MALLEQAGVRWCRDGVTSESNEESMAVTAHRGTSKEVRDGACRANKTSRSFGGRRILCWAQKSALQKDSADDMRHKVLPRSFPRVTGTATLVPCCQWQK